MQPFEVTWTDHTFAPIRDRIQAYRMPRTPPDTGWTTGCDPAFLESLCQHWAERFDVEAAAATLNRFPQLKVRVDGLELHAVHVVGEAEGQRPLLLTHGWPGSVYEFWDVIELLAFPSRHGGDPSDAFDVVVPSLPGYGFSDKPKRPIGARTTAGLFRRLMEALGYPRFLAQGGDWGAGVTTWLALDHPEAMRAIHLNYLLVQPSSGGDRADARAWKHAQEAVRQKLGAYSMLQATKPASLSYAMADNPVAQAAWIVERFHDWADLRQHRFPAPFGMDRLLTNVMIYVMNDAFATSTWFYAAAAGEAVRSVPEGRRVEVPTAFAIYHDTLLPPPPRAWVEGGYHVTRWVEQPHGGHFAAMEAPELFVPDLRAWGREAQPLG
ncbi:epoxide hydrolase [Lichenihabitans sp. Uapishka_5]|uniref:epoxide hydrolase family protein n=1 Tax=Lichenihabitans sp. Uapishka_5 TaxID=3037302 RepID=UPI0029E802E9|nr:epoxide hydrolase [Lichenihabitans sp. Uapishka_5]MDX7953561.1 epoxide hydrolase [Lichenihabitans sp. Uapishka_5]